MSSPIQVKAGINALRNRKNYKRRVSSRRFSKTVFLNSIGSCNISGYRQNLRHRINQTVSTSTISTSFSSFATSSTRHRLFSIRQRRLRSKLDRLNQTENFNLGRLKIKHTSQKIKTKTFYMSNKQNVPDITIYRPSFKVEKLLNDTRGMKKYLIDYDGLFEQYHKKDAKILMSFTSFESSNIETKDFIYSHSCSSGYLSEC